MKIFRSLIILMALLSIISCDAPKLNPLDPGNPDSKLGQLYGFVKTQAIPQQALIGTKVFWKNDNRILETDAVGYYELENLPMIDGILYFEKDGYGKDSIRINWQNRKSIDLGTISLNAIRGQFFGFVKTQAIPQQALIGVKVSWKNDNRILETDASGYYKLENLPMIDGTLYFEKDGYSKDSIRINWQNRISIDLGITLLNAIPKLDNLTIYTCVENRYPNNQKDTLYVQANISDAENDIDSVNVRCTALNFNKKLTFNSKRNIYELIYFYGTKNSVSPIDDAIGKNFEIIVKDHIGKIFNIGFSTIKRVIRQEILFESPANGVTVGSKPVCRWNRFLPGFNFQYMVQIYTDETIPQLMWQKQNISKEDIEAIPEISLPAGNYFWVVWCIDDFQNRARSKPATFNVQ